MLKALKVLQKELRLRMIYKILVGEYVLVCYCSENLYQKACILHSSALKHRRHQCKPLQSKFDHSEGVSFEILDTVGLRSEISKWVKLENPDFVLNTQGLVEKNKPVKKEKEITILHKPDLSNIEQMSEGELDVAINYYVRLGWNNLSPEDKINWGRINKVIASKRIFSQEHYLELQVVSILGEFNK